MEAQKLPSRSENFRNSRQDVLDLHFHLKITYFQVFKEALATDPEVLSRIKEVGDSVNELAQSFPIPGHELL